ncbi:endocuticle structural glycoprotein ABD-5-like isoform X1 [Maniola hyperantus]|uniref:endocuticle structural glycoprotein ABD-5-like isoform X1 n=1 Tax=Aphantopus hyperantus TaxID=2795564 RepID=UPI001569258C|nr:endocuticle structural glycoprotein ABD-5-like [Maniola hyperantus]
MKLLVILVCVAVAAAAPQAQRSGPNPEDVQILEYDTDNDGLGTYKYAFELSDGTKKEEQGELKNAGTDNEIMSVKGSYSWTAPDGVTYLVTYVADENGFNPTIEQGPGTGGSRG